MHLTQFPHGEATQRATAVSRGRSRHGWERRLLHQRWFIALRSFAIFTALWHALSAWNANPLQLPTPLAVVNALWDLAEGDEMLQHASISAGRLLLALAIAIAVAVPLGFWMGLSRTAAAYIDPLVELLRPISGIAWLPLALFIFGIGHTLPVFITVYVGFFPILLNTIAGVRQVDRKLVAAAQTWDNVRAQFRRTAPLVKQAFDTLGAKPAASEFLRTDVSDLRGRPVWEMDKWANPA